MDNQLSVKLDNLKNHLAQFSSAIIAFSGGTDSTLLAFIGKQVLGENELLVTAIASIYPQSEQEDAQNFSAILGLKLHLVHFNAFDIEKFASNPPDRCYYCKRELFTRIKYIACQKKISAVFDGSNKSDEEDFRPGKEAAKELGIISPLAIAGITKSDVYALSSCFNLPTANKPPMACLASRFPYGEIITQKKLSRVEAAEKELHARGYNQLRIRSHGDLARLEVTGDDIERAISERDELVSLLKKAGFVWCCLDLQGYRTGAMNESYLAG